MQHDRQITLSVASTRKSTDWKPFQTSVSELYERLKQPYRSTESLTDYLALRKAQQDELKDIGGFVGGTLSGSRRKANAVAGRDIITLDFDTVPPYGTDDILATLEETGWSYAVYSTRKHMPTAPRLRILLPLDRTVSADEYEPIARYIASLIGIQMADPTTFEASRLMYWPSCSSDGEYVFKCSDAPFLSADAALGTYEDWRNFSSWPQVPGANNYQRMALKQGDPESKPGIVGAFNRVYDIVSAMEQFLPGMYTQCDNDPHRYTYGGGSTTGGAVLYDNDRFLFSHHATDPCSGRLVNAFDLIRLHLFADKDDYAAPNTPVNRLPSFTAMCELATSQKAVGALLTEERHKQLMKDREALGEATAQSGEYSDWLERADLQINPKTGRPLPTIENIERILEYDPILAGKVRYNEFADRIEITGKLPWSKKNDMRTWTDADDSGLYMYMESAFDITKRVNIDAAFDVYVPKHAYHPVRDYLTSLAWDGKPRVDTLFVDYTGAQDSAYTRKVTRKILTAAVARIMEPGIKFDNMLVLCGVQGLGKSSILAKLSKGWFNDSIFSFEGKDAAELIQGVWIVEIAELNALRKSDVARVKQFMSAQADRYRPAYGRHKIESPRTCVFFGTVNEHEFLLDMTGNRRFWPVDTNVTPVKKSIWKDLTEREIDQIWAEAMARWQLGEPLYLTREEEAEAIKQQEAHMEESPMLGAIEAFIERKVPADWDAWPLSRRRDFWAGLAKTDEMELVERSTICALEVWCELYMRERANAAYDRNYRDIGRILDKILTSDEWVTKRVKRYSVEYGHQRKVYVRQPRAYETV